MTRVRCSCQRVVALAMVGVLLWSSIPCPAADSDVLIRGGRSSATRSTTAQSKKTPAVHPNTTAGDRPKWTVIEQAVKAALAKTQGYRAGDLLTREKASEVFEALKSRGWKVKSAHELGQRLLPASDEMVRLFQGKSGRKFMREIARVPGGYDRVDKLRKLPNGRRRLRELVHQPGGYTLIQYMATTRGGKNMGRELSGGRRGNFNAPTRRVYTEQDLLAALKRIYTAETETPSSKAPRKTTR